MIWWIMEQSMHPDLRFYEKHMKTVIMQKMKILLNLKKIMSSG